MSTISLVAAIGRRGELGKGNQLLWHIPEDMKRFRFLTSGHSVIMGQKTYESIGRALPNRTNIIMTKDASFHAKGCIVMHSLEDVMKFIYENNPETEVFVIGGGMIYTLFLPFAKKLYITLVDAEFDADVFFPEYESMFILSHDEPHSDENFSYRFTEWKRKISDNA